jgi:hypothetical protein
VGKLRNLGSNELENRRVQWSVVLPSLGIANAVVPGALQKQSREPVAGGVLKFQKLPAGCRGLLLGEVLELFWGLENKEQSQLRKFWLEQVPLPEDHRGSRAPSVWLPECSYSGNCLLVICVCCQATLETETLMESWCTLPQCLGGR